MSSAGRPREHTEERITKAVRISADLDGRLKEAAQQRDVSVNLLITTALEDYLERLVPVEQVLKTAS